MRFISCSKTDMASPEGKEDTQTEKKGETWHTQIFCYLTFYMDKDMETNLFIKRG